MTVHLVNPRGRNHKEVAKRLLENACQIIELADKGLAGFAIIGWDYTGDSCVRVRPGGMISMDILAPYAHSILTATNALDRGDERYENKMD